MDQAAITIYELSMLARCDPMSWDPLNIFERLIPRREIYLKRNLVHAADLQTFSRRAADDGGVVYTVRDRNRGGNAFDLALGAKDLAPVAVVSRPLFDLSAHVARTLRQFLENYPMRFSQIDFTRFRLSKLMAVLLRNHVRDYLGEYYAEIAEGDENHHHGGGGGGSSNTDTSSQYSHTGVQGVLSRALQAAKDSQQQLVSGSAASSSRASISTSVARAITGQPPEIRFGPPLELLSAAPLSIHVVPYGRNAFFPELMERRRQLEQQLSVDPDGWRSVVFPPKLVAAVLRFFVVVLAVPPRVVLQRLAEVLPAAVKMHYELSEAEEDDAAAAAGADSRKAKFGGVVIPFAKATLGRPGAEEEEEDQQATSSSKKKKKNTTAALSSYPLNSECGFGVRYYARLLDAATNIVQRAHMLTSDALVILHLTPHPVFGDKHESPLVKIARNAAMRQGMQILEKVDVTQQQEMLQVLGILAKRHPHVFICFEEVNACGGTLSPEVRLVLTRLANNKFTLLVDGTFAIANPCAAPTKHWFNSARNAPGTACADAYLLGCGAFLPTVSGRGAMVVYASTKTVLDVAAVLEDPLLPLLIDDGVVLHHEMVRVMGATEMTTEVTRAAHGIAEDAKKQLAGTGAVVRSGIVCIPLPHIAKQREMQMGRISRRSVNAAVMLEAPLAKSLERAGVTCGFLRVNLQPVPLQNPAGSAAALAESVGAGRSEENSVFCAVMFPHLQTIEQVPWHSVWRVLAGGRVEHPELAPTLCQSLVSEEEQARQRQLERLKRQQEREEELRREREDPEYAENKKLRQQIEAEKERLAAQRKQQGEDEEMLNMVYDIMGIKMEDRENSKSSVKKNPLSDVQATTESEVELLSRDPYSYAARLDNLLARYEPLRAGSARAMLDGMLQSAQEDFYGFKYDPVKSSAVGAARSPSAAAGGAGSLVSETHETVLNSILRQDTLEAIYLGRMVLRYGREPADNSFFLVTQVIRDFLPDQVEKLPVLMEAYAAAGSGVGARDKELLETLVAKYVPPHKKGLYRPRQMLLRSPVSPERDLALARRMVHKCLTSHRPDRATEVSSIAHLLAPLATLIRQGTANPLQLHRILTEEAARQKAVTAGLQEQARFEFSSWGTDFGGGGGEETGSAARDFLREEETTGKLVRAVLEQEIGIVPRVVGVSILDRADSPHTTGGATTAISSLVHKGDPSSMMVGGAAAAAHGGGGGGGGTPGRSASMFTDANGRSGSPFMAKLFGVDPNSGDSKIIPAQNHNFNFHRVPGSRLDDDEEDFQRRRLDSRSASLAMSAAGQAEAYQDRQQEIEALRRSGSYQDPVLGRYPQRLYHAPPPIRDRVVRIYARYAPDKVHGVDKLLRDWAGREEILVSALCTKYGPEPPYDAPIRSYVDPTQMANAEAGGDRPSMVGLMRAHYGTTQGPAGRAAIDELVDTAYPLEGPDSTAGRVHSKLVHELELELGHDV